MRAWLRIPNDPQRISFVDALEVIRLAVQAVEGCLRRDLVRLYVRLMTDLGQCRLQRWRRPRRCTRATRINTLYYRHKRTGER